MSDDRRTVCPNADEVAVEVLHGEAVLINLATGHYYSMDSAGAAIWELVDQRLSAGEIVRALTQQYDIAAEQARNDLKRLLDELEAERLVLPYTGPPVEAQTLEPRAARLPYETPRLVRYSDMADMLALDPPLPGLKDIPWKDSGRS